MPAHATGLLSEVCPNIYSGFGLLRIHHVSYIHPQVAYPANTQFLERNLAALLCHQISIASSLTVPWCLRMDNLTRIGGATGAFHHYPPAKHKPEVNKPFRYAIYPWVSNNSQHREGI